MTEHEPIELEPKPDKKGKVIYEAKKKEEPVKTPITKEAHRRNLLNQRDYCLSQIEQYKERVKSIEDMIDRIDEHEKAGMIVRCFDEGDNLTYEVHEKEPLGFHPAKKEVKDASTWKEENQARQAKKG
jgi:hypothetical protein